MEMVGWCWLIQNNNKWQAELHDWLPTHDIIWDGSMSEECNNIKLLIDLPRHLGTWARARPGRECDHCLDGVKWRLKWRNERNERNEKKRLPRYPQAANDKPLVSLTHVSIYEPCLPFLALTLLIIRRPRKNGQSTNAMIMIMKSIQLSNNNPHNLHNLIISPSLSYQQPVNSQQFPSWSSHQYLCNSYCATLHHIHQ